MKKTIIPILLFLFLSFIPFYAAAATVHVIVFNDFHGRVEESAKELGMAKFVTAVKQETQKYPEAIVVAGGDNYQGSVLSNLSFGAPVSDMMKEIGVTASAVGNHEFDWGAGRIKTWGQSGHFTFLAANVFDKHSHRLLPGVKPYLIVQRNGVKIAFIGLATLETPTTTSERNIKNLTFEDPSKATQRWIDYLKAGKAPEGRPDAILALTHIPSSQDEKTQRISGEELVNLIAGTHGLDAVMSAHSHRAVNGTVNGIPVIQASCYGQDLGELSLDFDDSTHHLKRVDTVLLPLISEKSSIIPDEHTLVLYKKYARQFRRAFDTVIGETAVPFFRFPHPGERSLIHWICEQVRQATKAEVVIQNEGFFRDDLPAGKITLGQMYEMLPFDNTIVTGELPGEQILKVLELRRKGTTEHAMVFSGVELEWDTAGQHIVHATLPTGKTIEPNKWYRIATNDFLYSGGEGCSFSQLKNVKDTKVLLRDIIVRDIEKQKIIH